MVILTDVDMSYLWVNNDDVRITIVLLELGLAVSEGARY